MIFVCELCGKEYTSNKKSSKHCSMACRQASRLKNHTKIICDHCGKEYSVTLNKIEQNEKRGTKNNFCSKKCAQEFQKPPFEIIKETFVKKGYTLLDTEYVDAKHKLAYICPKHFHTIQYITYNNIKNGYGCKYCGFEKTANLRRLAYDEVKEIFKAHNMTLLDGQKYTGTNNKLAYICDNHPEIGVQYMCVSNAYSNYCPYCHGSKAEKMISSFFQKNNIAFEYQKKFDGLLGLKGNPLKYDFYVPDKNMLVEYQGEYHLGLPSHQSEEDFEIQKEHDKRKKIYAKEHNIKLLEIWFYEKSNLVSILEKNFT